MHRLALLSQPRHNGPGQVRLSGARQAREQLSLSVFSLWQSPHSACKVCALPAKACLTGATWSSSQVPAVSPQPHSAHLPSCAARVFCLSAAPGTSRFAFSSFKKISCAKPARRWPLYSWLSASHHLRSTSCSSGSSRILVPRLSLSPQYCAGLLMATLGLSPAAMSWRRASRRSSHQNSPGCTSAASKRLHSGRSFFLVGPKKSALTK